MRDASYQDLLGPRPDQPHQYFKALDGLRGTMAIGVVVAHVNKEWFPGAEVMMDIFFVISGFLISLLLVKSLEKNGRIDLWHFTKNRLIRLYPLLAITIISTLFAMSMVSTITHEHLNDALQSLLYYSNFSKLEPRIFPTLFEPTWSLSIEEQFYVIWPLTLMLMTRLSLSLRQVALILLIFVAASIAWKTHLIETGAPWSRLYYGSDTRIDAFCVGAILAILWHTNLIPQDSKLFNQCCQLATIALALLVATTDAKKIDYFTWKQPVSLFLSCLCTLCMSMPQKNIFKSTFSHKHIANTGLICYGTYLWHWPLLIIFSATIESEKTTLLAMTLSATILMALASHILVERPLLSRRKRLF